MNKIITIAFSLMLISACGRNNDVCGTFEGTLPAASGPGIETTLTLNQNNTFELGLYYIGEEDGTFLERGNYTVDEGVIELQPKNGEPEYYQLAEDNDSVRRLDSMKQPITGELAEYYILRRTQICK